MTGQRKEQDTSGANQQGSSLKNELGCSFLAKLRRRKLGLCDQRWHGKGNACMEGLGDSHIRDAFQAEVSAFWAVGKAAIDKVSVQ